MSDSFNTKSSVGILGPPSSLKAAELQHVDKSADLSTDFLKLTGHKKTKIFEDPPKDPSP